SAVCAAAGDARKPARTATASHGAWMGREIGAGMVASRVEPRAPSRVWAIGRKRASGRSEDPAYVEIEPGVALAPGRGDAHAVPRMHEGDPGAPPDGRVPAVGAPPLQPDAPAVGQAEDAEPAQEPVLRPQQREAQLRPSVGGSVSRVALGR